MPHTNAYKIAIIGAGLAGCECAAKLSEQGIPSTLFEMKPHAFSPAHENPDLAELVCSNSLRSNDTQNAVGVLKEEMRMLGSLTMRMAEQTKVPAGKALAVDRGAFSRAVTSAMESDPNITVQRREIRALNAQDEPALSGFTHIVLAAGPMASDSISAALAAITGEKHLYFYDAIAPIVSGDSLDMSIVFRGSRYDNEKKPAGQTENAEQDEKDEGDYLNCPMNKEEYLAFYHALLEAQKAPTRDFEKESHFEGCMPIEALAERGEKTLVFGPLKPVGFDDPRTGRRPFALVQLRAENLNRSMFNLVGCQTKLIYSEQDRIFRMIPGLQNAEFARHGSMHRNTYVNAPTVLGADLSLLARPHIYLAGQITGVEGYVESAACGLWLGLSLGARLRGRELPAPPPQSALGALMAHLRTPAKKFQPSNVQYGLMPELGEKAKKANRKLLYAQRAFAAFTAWREEAGL